MKTAVLVFLAASTAFAQQQPHSEIYPNDYKPSACASKEECKSFTDVSWEQAAHAFLLRTLDPKWTDDHGDFLQTQIAPFCAKRATCNASPGRVWWFCNDVFSQELRASCDKLFDPKSQKDDNTQCRTWMDTFSAGLDQRGSADWAAAQKCAKNSAVAAAPHQMDWWAVPATIPVQYTGPIQIFAIDRETHVPVQADIRFQDQIIYATDPPNGTPTTYYVFKWPRKLVRVPNAEGHSDVVPVTMTLTAPGYDTVTTPVPTEVPKVVASLVRDGRKITVKATDSVTGKPVEGQVYFGTATVGFTNQPFELAIRKKHPELWVRSPFDAYSDVVVLKAN